MPTAAQKNPAPHGHGHDDGAVHPHLVSPIFYWAIFAGLIVLTLITVGVSYLDLGSGNTIVAILVATMKASLVAAFFMHLASDKLFNTICLLAAFGFLAIFFLFTHEDTGARNRIDDVNGSHVLPRTGEIAPGGMAPDPKEAEVPAGHGGAAAHH